MYACQLVSDCLKNDVNSSQLVSESLKNDVNSVCQLVRECFKNYVNSVCQLKNDVDSAFQLVCGSQTTVSANYIQLFLRQRLKEQPKRTKTDVRRLFLINTLTLNYIFSGSS